MLTWALINFVVGFVALLIAVRLEDGKGATVSVGDSLLLLLLSALPLVGLGFLVAAIVNYAGKKKILDKVLFRL